MASHTIPFKRPSLYRENVETQYQRNERQKASDVEKHTIRTIHRVAEWFEVQRELGQDFDEETFLTEAEGQIRKHGVAAEYIPAAVSLVKEIYSREKL